MISAVPINAMAKDVSRFKPPERFFPCLSRYSSISRSARRCSISFWSSEVQLNLSILSVFVMLLICLTMISLGFSIAYIFSQNIVTLMSQLILMIGLMFSPILYPAGRLPDWLDQLYFLLPFVPSANLLRASFYRHGTVSLVDIGVLVFWIFLTQLLILGTLQKEL